LDGVVYTDLTRAYNQNLEKQLLSGTGTNGQLTGVRNVTGRNGDIDGSSASTIANLWPLIGKLLAGVGNNRLQPVEALLLAPRRWAWIASSVDSSNRPIASPGQQAHTSDYPTAGGVAPTSILGFPAYQDGAIPAGTNADVIIALRPSDLLLYESTPKFSVLPDVLSGTLQVRLRLHRYVAFVIRRPAAITVLTGLAQPSGF
jgi:HK97 family phage major capsid protein